MEGGIDFSQAELDPETGKLCVVEEKQVRIAQFLVWVLPQGGDLAEGAHPGVHSQVGGHF